MISIDESNSITMQQSTRRRCKSESRSGRNFEILPNVEQWEGEKVLIQHSSVVYDAVRANLCLVVERNPNSWWVDSRKLFLWAFLKICVYLTLSPTQKAFRYKRAVLMIWGIEWCKWGSAFETSPVIFFGQHSAQKIYTHLWVLEIIY